MRYLIIQTNGAFDLPSHLIAYIPAGDTISREDVMHVTMSYSTLAFNVDILRLRSPSPLQHQNQGNK